MIKGKTCYYQLLGVDPKAPLDQIKSNYRKMVMKYHPDKNPQPDARQKFKQVQEAWEVLSDINQRTWYDNNRESVLYNKDDLNQQDYDMLAFGFNIWKYFSTSCFKGIDDSEEGFFSVYRKAFQIIKTQEKKAYDLSPDQQYDFRKMKGFGQSKTSLEQTLRFYDDWESFSSYKSFKWVDEYCLKDAPNRQVRRLMQKQNIKQRMKQKKKYLKTIKDLVEYVKKRDPRWAQIVLNMKADQEKKKQLQRVQQQRQKKRKEQNKGLKQQLQQKRLRQAEEYFKLKEAQEAKLGIGQDNDDYQDFEQFSCKVCKKSFKSKGQLQNHNQSKQHKTQLNKLKKQVMTESQLKQEQQEKATQVQSKDKTKNKNKNKGKKDSKNSQEIEINSNKVQQKVIQKQQVPLKKQSTPSQSQDSDQQIQRRLNAIHLKGRPQQQEIVQPSKKKTKGKLAKDDQFSSEQQKKQKKPKKRKEQSRSSSENKSQPQPPTKEKQKKKGKEGKEEPVKKGHQCSKCKQYFESKTKLFKHLQTTGHAAAKR